MRRIIKWAAITVLVIVGAAVAWIIHLDSPATVIANAAQASTQAAAPAQPSPVSTSATLKGSCVTGTYDLTTAEFYPMSSGGGGPASGDEIAEAYQMTLINNSSGTASVTGFGAVFYAQGHELTSDNETFDNPTFIVPGQSLTWTEYPWSYSSAGENEASVGPFAAGQMGAVDITATCSLVEWYHP
jgi:hypothetical protein